MSKTVNTFTCFYCGHTTDCANDVMPIFDEEGNSFECVFSDACARRQKRDKILAQGQVKAKAKANRAVVHPVDRFTRLSVALCGIFMGAVIAIGLSYLWLGI